MQLLRFSRKLERKQGSKICRKKDLKVSLESPLPFKKYMNDMLLNHLGIFANADLQATLC